MRKLQVAGLALVLALALALALAGCAAGLPIAEAPLAAGTANNALAVDLYRQLSGEPGNVVVSPASLAGAMAPVALGARGATRAGIDRALHFGPGDPTVALGADFAGIADAPLTISEVIQKSFLKIDEKGTEAAAVTAVTIVVTGMQIGREQTFIADHPFLFLIRDRPTGQILFIGRIEAPGAG